VCRAYIAAVISTSGDLIDVITEADPDDKAKIYAGLDGGAAKGQGSDLPLDASFGVAGDDVAFERG
jgi:hypothetical protein